MKKITLLLVAFAAFTLHTNAQTVVWMDDFNDEDVSDWTTTDSDGDGLNWGDIPFVGDGAGGMVTPPSLISRSWQGAALFPDNWIVSPVIDLTNAADLITVDWITQVADQPWDEEKYSIHVGTTDDITVLVNSTLSMTETLGDAGDTGTPTPHTIDISSMAGESQVYIAFRHWDCTDQDFLSVDDVTVTAETILSVEEFDIETVKTFYSATLNSLELESVNSALTNVAVYDVLGKQILNRNLSTIKESISLETIQDGVYIAKVSTLNSTKTIKFVKN